MCLLRSRLSRPSSPCLHPDLAGTQPTGHSCPCSQRPLRQGQPTYEARFTILLWDGQICQHQRSLNINISGVSPLHMSQTMGATVEHPLPGCVELATFMHWKLSPTLSHGHLCLPLCPHAVISCDSRQRSPLVPSNLHPQKMSVNAINTLHRIDWKAGC